MVGVASGTARYGYGLTLPDLRQDLGLSELVLGLVASATFAGYLTGLLLAGPLAAHYGSRAPTTVGGVSGALGAGIVTVAHCPGCSPSASSWPEARAAEYGRPTPTS
ncbi:MFS transporter [Arthrobacter sp. L77]|uniref:MFS transporter n=1 Tax=Arthrobacter sp. L77 TaxID=1496689 RepID=UPI0022B18166|nr:MFS transporter [Arthrobacter sp. L77]